MGGLACLTMPHTTTDSFDRGLSLKINSTTVQNRTEQNRTEQNRTEQNRNVHESNVLST